jgi:glycerate-2-kinase
MTDPTVPDTSTIADACATFDKFELWNKIPSSVKTFFGAGGGVLETPKSVPSPPDDNFVLLSASSPVHACQQAAEQLGYRPLVLSSSFAGESQALGAVFSSIAREVAAHGQPISRPCALIGGGETIVTMQGFEGLGGPNQEFALSGALELPTTCAAVVLGADTDGTDGPTDLAGAICDASTLARAKDRGIDLQRLLNHHNVTPVLEGLEDAILTGATGTNVNDLKLVLLS